MVGWGGLGWGGVGWVGVGWVGVGWGGVGLSGVGCVLICVALSPEHVALQTGNTQHRSTKLSTVSRSLTGHNGFS